MSIYRLLLFLFVALLLSCSSVPPPLPIKNGVYYSKKYGFSFEVPKGWQSTNEMPEWMKKEIPGWVVIKTHLMCFNNETNGFISVYCTKTNRSKLEIRKYLEDATNGWKQEVKDDPYIKDIKTIFYTPKTAPYSKLVETNELICENEYMKQKCEENTFVYSLGGESHSILILTLISRAQSFDENKKVYDKLVRSLKTS